MLAITKYFNELNIPVFVVFPNPGALSDRIRDLGIPIYFIANNWWTEKSFEGELTHRRMQEQLDELSMVVESERPDIIYTNTTVDIAGAILASRTGLPHVWHFREMPYNPEVIEMAVPRSELAGLIRNTTNLVVFNSRTLRNDWKDYLPAVDQLVVYNWIEGIHSSDRNEKSAEKPCFIHVGAVAPHKRQLEVIRAFKLLISEGYDCHLHVIGVPADLEYVASLVSFVAENGLEGRVTFTGHVQDPFGLFPRAAASITASPHESFGRTTVEAMAAGIPVIASAGGGSLEIVTNGVNGLLYPPGDIYALKELMKKTLEADESMNSIIAGGLVTARKFSDPSEQLGALVGKMQELVNQKNPSWPLMAYGLPLPKKNSGWFDFLWKKLFLRS